MRPFYLVIILFSFFSAPLPAQQYHDYNPFIDVQHYSFSIELNDLNDVIKASADITVLILQNTHTIVFDLINENKGKGMSVISALENQQPVLFDHTGDRIIIQLKNPGKAGETRTFKINYKGIPSDGLVFSKNKFGQRTIFGDNWPNRARNWLPCVDHLSDKASVDFMVTAPDHYRVISNGLLEEESMMDGHRKFTHWKETVALPTKVMVIGLADFAVSNAGSVDCIPVSSWVFPQDKIKGFYDYGQAMEILPFFIKMVGPYAYKKLANVEAVTIFGGMENASAIFYNDKSINGKRSYSEELIAHEIAHQWFGNMVTESGWPHVWLSEGFATEMTNLYLENKYGADTLRSRLKEDRETIIEFAKKRFTPIVDSSESDNFLLLLNHNSYEKGAWVLHMLRRKLGDILFWRGLRTYYATYAGKNASTEDFRTIMEATSGIGLKDFFQQWLCTPGHPVLKISWRYNAKKKLVQLKITQEQKQLFYFPLELAFKNTGSTESDKKTLLIRDKITQVEIPVFGTPIQVIADPETNLLFQGKIVQEKVSRE